MTTVSPADAVREAFAGEVLAPHDPGYDEARHVFNGMIDRHPAIIARCATTEDVVKAVEVAHDSGRLVAVRGGGHSFAGLSPCDAGIVIDLNGLKSIVVGRGARTARAGGGVYGASSTPPRRRMATHAGRPRHHHRDRRVHPRRRVWLELVEVRVGLRQPDLGRGRARRRRRLARKRGGASGSVLGGSGVGAGTSGS